MVFQYIRSSVQDEWRRALQHFDYDVCERYSRHMLLGLQVLHRCGIAHRDLSMPNCLVDARENAVKLADMGLSVCSDDFVIDRQVCQWQFRPLEVCLLGGEVQRFSLGVRCI